MSHVDHGYSEKEQSHNGRSFISMNETTPPSRISDILSNVLMGIVISKTEGLTWSTVRIRVGKAPICAYVGKLPVPRPAQRTSGKWSP